jgi:hypothetical protein
VFVSIPSYLGPERVWIKNFDGVGEPLQFRENRKQKAPEKKLVKATGRPPKSRDNLICFQALNDHFNIKSAAYEYPFIEDIIVGVSNLDWEGTRGLIPEKLFILLSCMQVITSDLVRELTWCSDRHSRNLALALRICAEAFEMAYSRLLVQAENQISDLSSLEAQDVGQPNLSDDLDWNEFLLSSQEE